MRLLRIAGQVLAAIGSILRANPEARKNSFIMAFL